eukprot:5472449-Pyramimonas_sp.AAC.1
MLIAATPQLASRRAATEGDNAIALDASGTDHTPPVADLASPKPASAQANGSQQRHPSANSTDDSVVVGSGGHVR